MRQPPKHEHSIKSPKQHFQAPAQGTSQNTFPKAQVLGLLGIESLPSCTTALRPMTFEQPVKEGAPSPHPLKQPSEQEHFGGVTLANVVPAPRKISAFPASSQGNGGPRAAAKSLTITMRLNDTDQTHPTRSDNASALCPTTQGPKHTIRRGPLQSGAGRDHGKVRPEQLGMPSSSIPPPPCCRPRHTPHSPPTAFPPDDRFAARNFRPACLRAHVLVRIRQDQATK